MFRLARRTDRLADLRFCDSCAEVTTGAERARRYYDRAVDRAHGQLWPR